MTSSLLPDPVSNKSSRPSMDGSFCGSRTKVRSDSSRMGVLVEDIPVRLIRASVDHVEVTSSTKQR